jgi:hypothetical protein
MCMATSLAAQSTSRVLVDQVGYERTGQKQAIVTDAGGTQPRSFRLLDATSGKVVLQGKLSAPVRVDRWGAEAYSIADFSAWQQPGAYIVSVGDAPLSNSSPFAIEDNVLERLTLSNVVFYFKGQRSSGAFDEADRHLKLPAGEPGTVDVHGGWYDATGDYGIHLSHQNPTSFFNPQQVPLVAWTLLAGQQALVGRRDENFTQFERRMLDEGLYGADFLVRMKRPGGSFFETISAPGPQKLAKDREIGNPNWRTQIKKSTADSTEHITADGGSLAYQAGFRSGAGVAIAALALASEMPMHGEFASAEYLRAAEEAFHFLEAHNPELLNDHIENILDDYTALLAATELYAATHSAHYHEAAERRAESLMSRLTRSEKLGTYWRADAGERPFFHPADAGLPVVSLLRYRPLATAEQQGRIDAAVRHSLEGELARTRAVANPFDYARQPVRLGNGEVRDAFFFPHSTEAAPWWQGEDARLASLAAAARMAAPLYTGDQAFQAALENYADDQLHWILGRNPFDASMLVGSGHGTPLYLFFRSYQYASPPGAILNGITAADNDEDGIAFNQGFVVTGKDEDWRWTESWLPHGAWYLYAVCLPHVHP